MKKIASAAFVLLVASAGGAEKISAAQAPAPKSVTAVRTGGPIRVDGRLTEEVWQTPGSGGFTQTDPRDGAPASEETTVWVAYDRENLYVAARLRDSEPEKIIRLLARRDEGVQSDWFYFGIDPYHDRRTGYYFAVNPAGSIMDGTLYNDEFTDPTWDGIWESAVRTDGEGWAVEMKIPFDQLRFKKQPEYAWAVNFERDIKRKNETDFFSWKPKEESGLVSRFAELVGVRDIDRGRRLEAYPYTAGRAETSPAVPGNPFRTGRSFAGNAGFDLKAGLKSNLTLDATVNPDFGQVEVDPAVINISDQETYYVEKRPFFIEGSSIFNFGAGGLNVNKAYGWTDPEFFYSRRIGRSPQGAAAGPGFVDMPDWTTILGAAKVTGKIGQGFNLGAITAITQREFAEIDQSGTRTQAEVEPFSNYTLMRGLKEFGDGRQGLGFMATSVVRDLRAGPLENSLSRSALSFGVDGWTFLDKNKGWVVSGWAGATNVTGTPEAMTALQLSPLHYFQRPDAGYVHVDATATSLSGWAGRVFINKQKGNLVFNAALGAMSPGFEANDLGYHTRGDLINGHAVFGYQTFHPDKVFRHWMTTVMYYRNYDFGGNRIGEYIYLDAAGQFLNYWTAALHYDYEPPKYSHYLTRGGPMAYYPSGTTYSATAESDSRKVLVFELSGRLRTHPSGGYNWTVEGGLTWKPRTNISLSVGPGYTWRYSNGEWVRAVIDPLKVETYGTRYILADIVQKTLPVEIRLNWTFTPRLSLQAYLQPFVGSGDYRRFKELRAARTFDFNFFGEYDASTISLADGVYTVDPDGAAGPAPSFTFREPDFRLRSLRGTFVLRWEYRPGSMLYFVWTQKRADTSLDAVHDLWDDLGAIFRASGENIFLLKFSYRFEL
jgi:hypothetical protein